eukprot:14262-Heterococcus_DN1.PRE.1
MKVTHQTLQQFVSKRFSINKMVQPPHLTQYLTWFSVPAFKKSAKPLWKALRAAGSWSSAELSCSRSVAGLPA